jgi:hypothetical protein
MAGGDQQSRSWMEIRKLTKMKHHDDWIDIGGGIAEYTEGQ